MDLALTKILRLISRRFVLLALKIFTSWNSKETKTYLYGSKYGNWRLPQTKKLSDNATY